MSLNFNLSKDKVKDTFNSLVKIHKKNISFFATPTNETYRIPSYNSYYDREYSYKFCYSINGNINFNGNIYNASNDLVCLFYKDTGEIDVKNVSRNGSVAAIQNTYTNSINVNSPHLTLENYGEVYYNAQVTGTFFLFAFVFVIFVLRNIMPRLR